MHWLEQYPLEAIVVFSSEDGLTVYQSRPFEVIEEISIRRIDGFVVFLKRWFE